MVVSAATVTLSGAIGLTTTLTATSPHLVIAKAGATLSGGGALDLTNHASNAIKGAMSTAVLTNGDRIAGAGALSGLVLVNQAGGVIDGDLATALTIDTGASTVKNAGLIENAGAGGTTILSAMANSGTLMVTTGTLAVAGAVTGAGTVRITGGTAAFGAAFGENVTFTKGVGVLELADSQGYTGRISGFANTAVTSLDLDDIAFTSGVTKATYSGAAASGTLTVTDGTHTARIKLTGNYTASTFTVASDGHGGTTVVDPAKAPAAAAPLAAAIAVFGPHAAAGAATHAQAPSRLAPLVARISSA
jgi:hypothetical protein